MAHVQQKLKRAHVLCTIGCKIFAMQWINRAHWNEALNLILEISDQFSIWCGFKFLVMYKFEEKKERNKIRSASLVVRLCSTSQSPPFQLSENYTMCIARTHNYQLDFYWINIYYMLTIIDHLIGKIGKQHETDRSWKITKIHFCRCT